MIICQNQYQQSSFITKSGLQRSKDKSPVPLVFKQCICEGLLQIFYYEIRLLTKRILNPSKVFITQNLPDITKKIAEQTNRLPVFRYARTITYQNGPQVHLTLPLLIIEKSIIPPLMLLMMSIKTFLYNIQTIKWVLMMSINNTRANLLH